jgi:hypothetical protein
VGEHSLIINNNIERQRALAQIKEKNWQRLALAETTGGVTGQMAGAGMPAAGHRIP